MQLCEISLLMLNMLLNQQDWILCFLLSEKKKWLLLNLLVLNVSLCNLIFTKLYSY